MVGWEGGRGFVELCVMLWGHFSLLLNWLVGCLVVSSAWGRDEQVDADEQEMLMSGRCSSRYNWFWCVVGQMYRS